MLALTINLHPKVPHISWIFALKIDPRVPLTAGLTAGEKGVIDMALLSVIRRWYFREEMPIRETARRTGLS